MERCDFGSIPFANESWLIDLASGLQNHYSPAHPYITLFLCISGTLLNAITVAVLTRPTMLSPVNALLCAVAICDILVMSTVLIFTLHFSIGASGTCDQEDFTKTWATFAFVHSQSTVVFHATSIWLTVILAQIRVLTISRATTGPAPAITVKFTIFLALATFIVVSLVNVPNLLNFEIIELPQEVFCMVGEEDVIELNATSPMYYTIKPTDEDCGQLKLVFWANGLLFKVVPCILLTISILALLKIISDVSDRRKSLAQVMKKKRMPKDHTTPMLVAVLSIFLVAELPQGILHVCNAIFTEESFYHKVYIPLGDLMDLLSTLNSAVGFLIYCAMSRKFRVVFLQLFMRCLPQTFLRSLRDDTSGMADFDLSRHRPSAITDLTKTEQLALTSHRPSATSMLMVDGVAGGGGAGREKMYCGNLLTVGDGRGIVMDQPSTVQFDDPPSMLLDPCPRLARNSRVSFDDRALDAKRLSKNSGTSEVAIPVPKLEKPKERKLSFVEWLRGMVDREEMRLLSESSPQRRLNLLHMEAGTPR